MGYNGSSDREWVKAVVGQPCGVACAGWRDPELHVAAYDLDSEKVDVPIRLDRVRDGRAGDVRRAGEAKGIPVKSRTSVLPTVEEVGAVVGRIHADAHSLSVHSRRLVFSNASCLFGWHLDHELACRELDDALGLTEEFLQESRGGRNVQHRLVSLPMQSVYSRLAGYEDTNDAERLAEDPTMRVIVGRRGGPERPAASTNTMSRFETEVLTQDGNVEGLGRLNAKWVAGAMSRTAHRRVILYMNSSESPVHGEQEGASYNGHFGSMRHHPLFVFNQFGDCEGAMLRAGNVHSSHRWRDVLDPILSRYGATGVRRYFGPTPHSPAPRDRFQCRQRQDTQARARARPTGAPDAGAAGREVRPHPQQGTRA